MQLTGIDHLYAEPLTWDPSVSFWQGLGFDLVEQWGSAGHRAGRLQCGGVALVLAEIAEGHPDFTVFFTVEDAAGVDPPGTIRPLEDTHWGTRWIRVEDADGRVQALEEQS